jgi:L-2-hydroxyglutarate oxidase LhgO
MTNGKSETQVVPFRGDYYVLREAKRHMVRGMIYPVPDPRFPFLGVHFTKRVNGEIWAGPNAVLAFAREGYGRWDIKPKELWEAISYKGFRKLAFKYWKTGLAEIYRDYSKRAYTKELQRYMPAVTADDLVFGPSGVRAQALDPAGQLVDDFLIRQGTNIAHVLNAPSPAATSSLVVARLIVDKINLQFVIAK